MAAASTGAGCSQWLSASNCAEPAYTTPLMVAASSTLSPCCCAITPHTTPNGTMPTSSGNTSCMPARTAAAEKRGRWADISLAAQPFFRAMTRDSASSGSMSSARRTTSWLKPARAMAPISRLASPAPARNGPSRRRRA